MLYGARKSKEKHIKQIRDLAEQGWHAQRIADRLDLSRGTVYSYAWMGDIEIPRAKNPYHEECRIRRQKIVDIAKREPGRTRVSIALEMGVSAATVHRILTDHGIPTTRQYDANGNLIDQPEPSA